MRKDGFKNCVMSIFSLRRDASGAFLRCVHGGRGVGGGGVNWAS